MATCRPEHQEGRLALHRDRAEGWVENQQLTAQQRAKIVRIFREVRKLG